MALARRACVEIMCEFGILPRLLNRKLESRHPSSSATWDKSPEISPDEPLPVFLFDWRHEMAQVKMLISFRRGQANSLNPHRPAKSWQIWCRGKKWESPRVRKVGKEGTPHACPKGGARTQLTREEFCKGLLSTLNRKAQAPVSSRPPRISPLKWEHPWELVRDAEA